MLFLIYTFLPVFWPGTFCTLDICLSRLEDIGTIDVHQTVQRMRTQRAFSIQTWDQYYFCYTAVIEYAQRNGKLSPVQWSDSDLETDSEWETHGGIVEKKERDGQPKPKSLEGREWGMAFQSRGEMTLLPHVKRQRMELYFGSWCNDADSHWCPSFT